MNGININNEWLLFDGDIAFVEYSPIFYDIISRSLQFNVDDDQGGINRRIFGFLNKPEIDDNQTKELICNVNAGVISFPGTIVVKWQNNKFVCYLKECGDFWSAIKDKMLREIPFDIVPLNKTYNEMDAYTAWINASIDNKFAFPFVLKGAKSDVELGVSINFYDINSHIADPETNMVPAVIPFLYLKYIYRQIFEKNGISIEEDIFQTDDDLKRLILPNNFLVNEFELDATVLEIQQHTICSITNTTDPLVTTIRPHGITNHRLIKLSGCGGLPVDNRFFQIEVQDEKSFTLMGEDFSAYDGYNNAYPVNAIGWKNDNNDQDPAAHFRYIVGMDKNIGPERDFLSYVYIYSDNFEGFGIYKNYVDAFGEGILYSSNPDFSSYTNITFIPIPADITLPNGIFSVSNAIPDTIKLLASIKSNFKNIDPKNHVPEIKIFDFIKETSKLLAIYPFLSNNEVKIKCLKDILLSQDYIDISDFSTDIQNIENPAITGYKLSFKADSNDDFYKSLLDVQTIDPKYTILDPVAMKTSLPIVGSNTNDVRLVLDENKWYSFNKSFLNADNNWKVLTYNLLDIITGDGALVKESAFSPLLSELNAFETAGYYYYRPKMDIPFACKNFPADTKMAPRLMYYHGIINIGIEPTNFNMAYCSGDIFPWDGHSSPVANFIIRWDKENGILNKFLKQELYWQLNVKKDCIATILWPNRLMANPDFSKKYRIRGTDYLVKSRKWTVNLKTENIKFNDTELAKV